MPCESNVSKAWLGRFQCGPPVLRLLARGAGKRYESYQRAVKAVLTLAPQRAVPSPLLTAPWPSPKRSLSHPSLESRCRRARGGRSMAEQSKEKRWHAVAS